MVKIFILPVFDFFFEWILGIEIPYSIVVGKGFRIFHIQAIVINKNSIIGKKFYSMTNYTIGNKGENGKSPVIGDSVNIVATIYIIGNIIIGDNVNIGAGSIVV